MVKRVKKLTLPCKKIISETKEEISPYEFEGTLISLRNKLDEYIKEYGEDTRVDWDPHRWYPYDDSPSPVYYIKKDREETDSEFQTRIAVQKENEEKQLKREKEEFERLQKKFGAK